MRWIKGTYKTRSGAEVEITSVSDGEGLQGYVKAEWNGKQIQLHHSWDLAGVCLEEPELDLVELLKSERYNRSLG